jgi:hypothetical protein
VCNRENSQSDPPSGTSSDTSSNTPSGTRFDTPSGTRSNTQSVEELAVGTLAACGGRISDLGFVPPHGLQLQSSLHLILGGYVDR